MDLIRAQLGSFSVVFDIIEESDPSPQKDLKGLFGSFYRATNVKNIQGTGLGLSIVKEFTELHGGTITVDSEENKGSEFTVELPLS